MPDNTCACSA
ncbi:hypothetical protein IEO21_05776 [Rhodonia placenta]|uniref:Uncharacterized protein n=1 Tax=Rhodonia placenta TaxID=104341 RepID=A0A8H7P192_9APHY|nr:hypothetical protein IEO21_05776 [Postia placenta]